MLCPTSCPTGKAEDVVRVPHISLGLQNTFLAVAQLSTSFLVSRFSFLVSRLSSLLLSISPFLLLAVAVLLVMPRAIVVRRLHFNAAHRLHNPAKSAEWNRTTFGPCNNANYHGHN